MRRYTNMKLLAERRFDTARSTRNFSVFRSYDFGAIALDIHALTDTRT
jgi:hypothetical protein